MAELTSFSFVSGDSLLHHLDARFKIIFIISLSLVSLNLNYWELGILSIMIVAVIVYARLPLRSGFKELVSGFRRFRVHCSLRVVGKFTVPQYP